MTCSTPEMSPHENSPQLARPNGRTPARVKNAAVERLASLTPREAEVLAWVIEGKRNAEIASILGTSVNTIHKHVQRILAKLGVETRTAAARCATENGFKAGGGGR